MRGWRTILAAGGMLALLGGCAGMELGRARDLDPQGSTFENALYAGYVKLAQSEFDEGDYRDSDAFALRAKASGLGEAVEPEPISARELPAGKSGELFVARDRLVKALEAGARSKFPEDVAHAQVMFDCWMQEQEENFQPDDIAACRGGFETSMLRLEGWLKPREVVLPEPVDMPKMPRHPRAYLVFFDFDSAKLGDAAQQVISRIVAAIKDDRPKRIRLSGHADRSGTEGYNQTLSELRTVAVENALARKGAPAVRVETRAYGETRPFVVTGDGVREPQNRVVFVTLED